MISKAFEIYAGRRDISEINHHTTLLMSTGKKKKKKARPEHNCLKARGKTVPFWRRVGKDVLPGTAYLYAAQASFSAQNR